VGATPGREQTPPSLGPPICCGTVYVPFGKLRAYCELGELHDQTQQALDENDAEAIDALMAVERASPMTHLK